MSVIKFSDIKVRHIYNVIFDPVKSCEFDGKHLALVLKKNNDNQTFVVMPFTSTSNGTGVNKIKLDTIQSLPTSIRSNDTYAVFNQIRTVNASRFIALKEGINRVDSKIDDNVFMYLLNLGIQDMVFCCTTDEKISLLKSMHDNECITKARGLAYTIIGLEKEVDKNQPEIDRIKHEIFDILINVPSESIKKVIDDKVILGILL